VTFIGIDFGWTSQPSGCAALDGELRLMDLTRCDTPENTLAWIDRYYGPAMAAVDAPLVIPNETGMRVPDRLTHVHFGKFDAGCYPANRGSRFADRVTAFSRALSRRGYRHAAAIVPELPGRYQIEVYPHAAAVRLFGLPKILKYKKGAVADRVRELNRYRRMLQTLHPWKLPVVPNGGAALKAVEDQLDAVLCAYVGWHWWRYGLERNQVLGNRRSGYLVVPS
jgi:predicted RNase H-like nuclease